MQLTTTANISLKTTLMNFTAIWVKRSQKEEFFASDKFDNHTTDAEKERAIEEEERSRREKEKKTSGYTLRFYIGYSGDNFCAKRWDWYWCISDFNSLIPSDAVWSDFSEDCDCIDPFLCFYFQALSVFIFTVAFSYDTHTLKELPHSHPLRMVTPCG